MSLGSWKVGGWSDRPSLVSADGPKHGFVRKQLLVVPPDTELPPANPIY